MKDPDITRLDFDSLVAIAQKDPLEFERLRQKAIDDFIESVPVERRERLRGLQWRIDQERRNRTPLSACIRISKMMWEQLMESGGFLGPRLEGKPHGETRAKAAPAKVLSFPLGSGRRD